MHFKVEEADLTDMEILRVMPSKNRVEASVTVFYFENDGVIVSYIPSLEISGYGKTTADADHMLNESVKFYLHNLIKLSPDAVKLELSKLGWARSRYKHKEYSKSFIDKEGILRDFQLSPDDLTEKKLELVA